MLGDALDPAEDQEGVRRHCLLRPSCIGQGMVKIGRRLSQVRV
ncbi:MAG: hypothetical protein WKF83_17055 [Nocardioidaceae bacterium]